MRLESSKPSSLILALVLADRHRVSVITPGYLVYSLRLRPRLTYRCTILERIYLALHSTVNNIHDDLSLVVFLKRFIHLSLMKSSSFAVIRKSCKATESSISKGMTRTKKAALCHRLTGEHSEEDVLTLGSDMRE